MSAESTRGEPPKRIRKSKARPRSEWKRLGTPQQPLRPRFEAKVLRTETCHLWVGAKGEYGTIGCRKGVGQPRTLHAHRVAWQLYRGEIPKGMHVLHKCNNKMCVNPDHLYLGTHADNMRDAAAAGLYKRQSEMWRLRRLAKLVKEEG